MAPNAEQRTASSAAADGHDREVAGHRRAEQGDRSATPAGRASSVPVEISEVAARAMPAWPTSTPAIDHIRMLTPAPMAAPPGTARLTALDVSCDVPAANQLELGDRRCAGGATPRRSSTPPAPPSPRARPSRWRRPGAPAPTRRAAAAPGRRGRRRRGSGARSARSTSTGPSVRSAPGTPSWPTARAAGRPRRARGPRGRGRATSRRRGRWRRRRRRRRRCRGRCRRRPRCRRRGRGRRAGRRTSATLRLHGGEVGLAAEAGVDGHHQHHVDEVEHVLDGRDRRGRVEGDAGRRAGLAHARRACGAGGGTDSAWTMSSSHPASTQRAKRRVGVDDHEVGLERHRAVRAGRRRRRRARR